MTGASVSKRKFAFDFPVFVYPALRVRHLFFLADHDDHHLARIAELRGGSA